MVVKKTFRYSNVFSCNHLYQPECFYEKRYINEQEQYHADFRDASMASSSRRVSSWANTGLVVMASN